MTKFLIAATDIATGATVYARTSPTGRTVAFRNGVSISGNNAERIRTLNMLSGNGTQLDSDVACALLTTETQRITDLGDKAWVRDLRIVVA